MHHLISDHELIREVMVRFGEIMDSQGYEKVLEDIEGHGAIGKAVRDPRSIRNLQVINSFLKDIGKELASEPPSQEKANAVAALQAVFGQVKDAVQKDPPK